MQRTDVAIAGAGIIGLASALELAAAGLRVVVFERGHAMRECSWAAAGMLAASDPENPSSLRQLSELSLSLYPEFLANIEQLSGKKIPIRTTQTLHATHDLPSHVEPLRPQAIQAIAPGLQSNGLQCFLLEEQSLDPRDLTEALPAAAAAAGVTLQEHTAVTAVVPQSDSVKIQTTRGEWTAAHFINACGAWASNLNSVPVAPRKGQIFLVECNAPELLRVALRTPQVYLLPRGNGRIIIGATVEDAGYDKHIDPATITALHEAAADLWSPVRSARVVESWAGLRPATPDSLPVISPAIDIDAKDMANAAPESRQNAHSWLAIGHFRNGILLAPGTARLLRQMILKELLSIDTAAFHANRFTASLAR